MHWATHRNSSVPWVASPTSLSPSPSSRSLVGVLHSFTWSRPPPDIRRLRSAGRWSPSLLLSSRWAWLNWLLHFRRLVACITGLRSLADLAGDGSPAGLT